jgi:MFS family permease
MEIKPPDPALPDSRTRLFSLATMAGLVLVLGLGENLAERFLPLYIVAIGGTFWVVGIFNGLDNLLSALYSLIGGYCSQRWGYKRSLIGFTLLAVLGYLLVIFIPTWQAVLVGSALFIAWTSVTLPAVMSLVSRVMPRHRRAFGVSIHSFTKRIPRALGPMITAALIAAYDDIAIGMRIAFAIACVMACVSVILVWRWMADEKPGDEKPGEIFAMFRNLQGGLRHLLVADILVRFAEQIPYAFIAIWCVKNQGISEIQFSWLTGVEMVTAMLVYIPVALLSDHYGKKPFILVTFGFFTAFPLALFFAKGMAMLYLAFIVRGLKEFGEPTRKALILDLAPEHEKAGTFGAYYLVRDVIVSLAAFGSAWLWNFGPGVNFTVATVFGILGMLYFAIFGRDLGKSPELPPPENA